MGTLRIVSGRERDHGELWVNVVHLKCARCTCLYRLQSVLTTYASFDAASPIQYCQIPIAHESRLQHTSISNLNTLALDRDISAAVAMLFARTFHLLRSSDFAKYCTFMGECKHLKAIGSTASCLHYYKRSILLYPKREILACLRLSNFRLSICIIGISHLNEWMGGWGGGGKLVEGHKCNICQYHYQSHELAFCLKYERINGGANRSRSSKTVMLQEWIFFSFVCMRNIGANKKSRHNEYGLDLKKLKKKKKKK